MRPLSMVSGAATGRLFGMLLALGAAPASAVDFGPESLVNSYTTSDQNAPRVAAAGDGSFVVVWESNGSSGTDTSFLSVKARRFGTDGAPQGGDIQVNTYTTGLQREPVVAVDGSNRFVVAWTHRLTGNAIPVIQAQRFDDDGAPLGGEFAVNNLTTGSHEKAAIGADSAGRFVVVWQATASPGNDTSNKSVQARRFDADGTPLGDEFQVNTYTDSSQQYPGVAVDLDGSFVVVWESYGSLPGTDTSQTSIQARRYDPDGVPRGDQFQVNTYTTSQQNRPAVASDGLGAFVVAWESLGASGPGADTSNTSVQARRYAPNGTPVGEQFQVNSHTTGFQGGVAAASDADGNFLIFFRSSTSAGSDQSLQSIQVARFASTGDPLCGQMQANQLFTAGDQNFPSGAGDANGRFVAAWQSDSALPGDGGRAVVGVRFGAYSFCDGFESGSTGAWIP